ncbi:DUF6257 family protein [Streptomyces sp. NBC_00620]|uniref:DUF6257 family protein n=1 Tax=Streptomyces sp. NBC_00620 TaxID=2903666 RepID=UPI00224E1FC6|nr:DUF6257 family protein [Streptomyces sp. NBC_00620]MCX4974241.1 DUF6257 family protein [Streptomyces sp. NBC_00620]
MAKEPKLTAWEKARIVAIEAHGIKRAIAGITDQPDIDRRIKRIKDRARRRATGSK